MRDRGVWSLRLCVEIQAIVGLEFEERAWRWGRGRGGGRWVNDR